jgi:uncharacterized MAPEG superfamily protein
MKPELMWLVWAVALAVVQIVVAVTGAFLQVGLLPLVGNRENFPVLAGWAGRADRAYRNMLQCLVLFAPLVLVAVVAGKTSSATLLGAQLVFWARVVYAFVYLAGIPWLRTAVWTVSVVGLAIIFFQLV